MQSGKFVRGLVGAVALLVGGYAHAAYTVTISQVGPDVVATGSGTLDLTGLASIGNGAVDSKASPTDTALVIGSTVRADVFSGIAGPTSYGAGPNILTSTNSGDKVGFYLDASFLYVPQGYGSGALLSSGSTWNGTTIAGLGMTPGTYTWTWAGDSFTLQIGPKSPAPTAAPASIPTLSEWGLIGLSGLVALFGLTRVRRRG